MSRTTNCLGKKGLSILDSNIWWSDVLKDVTYISFEDIVILFLIVFVRSLFGIIFS